MFSALEIHEPYYGFSKVVINPWKNQNNVRGYRCSGNDLHGMVGTWFTVMTTMQLCDADSNRHEFRL